MPLFLYRGRNENGEMVEGSVDAPTEEFVVAKLMRERTNPISISLKPVKQEAMDVISDYLKLGYPSGTEMVMLMRQLYALTRAAVPIIRTLKVVGDGTKNPRLKKALYDVVGSIESGQSLAVAMNRHPLIFPTLMIYLITVGENTGSLEEIFRQLSVHFERELDMKRKAVMVLRYPMFVIFAILIAVMVINIFVIPAFAAFFKSFGAELPIYTRLLISMSDIMVSYWHIFLIGLAFIFFATRAYLRTYKGRLKWDKWKLRLPVFGRILEETMLARFARTFALCQRTGVPLLESVHLIANATDNFYVSEKVLEMRKGIERGETLTVSATNTRMFKPLILQMIAIGEESGEIDRLLDEVANTYEDDVDYSVKKLADAIEPILITIIGGFVLILALGVYLPMWNLSHVILSRK